MSIPLYTIGNKKVGEDTIIINIGPAMECPSYDMCILKEKCYARNNEKLRPSVLNFRKRQQVLWDKHPASWYINYFKMLKNDFLKYIRFQESGDFRNQDDVEKMFEIASGLTGIYKCYTYTCRYDLNYDHRPKNLVMTGSSFMLDNMFMPFDTDAYNMLTKNKDVIMCKNNCRICNYCKVPKGLEIYQKKH